MDCARIGRAVDAEDRLIALWQLVWADEGRSVARCGSNKGGQQGDARMNDDRDLHRPERADAALKGVV